MDGQINIREFWCVIFTDKDGTEGVPAIEGPRGEAIPLYTTNPANLGRFSAAALQLARERGGKCVVAKFSHREDIARFIPAHE